MRRTGSWAAPTRTARPRPRSPAGEKTRRDSDRNAHRRPGPGWTLVHRQGPAAVDDPFTISHPGQTRSMRRSTRLPHAPPRGRLSERRAEGRPVGVEARHHGGPSQGRRHARAGQALDGGVTPGESRRETKPENRRTRRRFHRHQNRCVPDAQIGGRGNRVTQGGRFPVSSGQWEQGR